MTQKRRTELFVLIHSAIIQSGDYLKFEERIWLVAFINIAEYSHISIEEYTILSRISKKFPELLGIQVRAIIESKEG